ncbi:hypothetical protein DFH29DRAFT_1021055 [Suillus ampliporus]|nr:hypothetical protein DFH29DRAFT_1021055 [Suillus ampliporus]
MLERHFDLSKFSSCAFIPGFRDGQPYQFSHNEVFSDVNWELFGFGSLHDKKNIAKLKIRDCPTTEKLYQLLKSNPPKNPVTAEKWFEFLAEKGVFSATEFERIADLKIVPVEVSFEEPQLNSVSYETVLPCECFLKSESYPEDHLYQRLFKFVNFGRSANAFLKACGIKERPECMDILNVLLKCPKVFLEMAGDDKKYLTGLCLIAEGHKSLPQNIHDDMHKSSHETDVFKLCKAEEVLVADDKDNCDTFGNCIYIAPREELLEKFYLEMNIKSLSSYVKYTVDPDTELNTQKAETFQMSIIEKIPIFLHEFDEQLFKQGMRSLQWDDDKQFFVRACQKLHVTKRLEFVHATVPLEQKEYPTQLSAETQLKDGINVLWIMESKAGSYDIAVALCHLLFSTYKKNDVLSLMTILDTDINVLRDRGYDVDRILSEYHKNIQKAEHGGNITNGTPPVQAQLPAPSPREEPVSSQPAVLSKITNWLRKDSKSGKIKLSDIENSIEKVMMVMQEEGGQDDKHISNREHISGGRKQKNVGYCNDKRVVKTDLDECKDQHVGQTDVFISEGITSDVPSKECVAFGKIISDLATVFGINQTRCHVFYHDKDSNLMGFNRNDQIFFGLEHYMQNHKDAPIGKVYIDWQALNKSPSINID